jgi:hypothetical protein
MSTGLSESNIELAENFISANVAKTIGVLLSICDIDYGVICFEQIKTMEPTSYVQFGSNACGYSSYGFYKTKNEQIYIIEAFCNNIVAYYEPKTCGFGVEEDNVTINQT